MANYELLQKFAAGDEKTLQSVVDDSRVFVILLTQAVVRKEDRANQQFSMKDDPERSYFSGELDMRLAEGIEKLYQHIAKGLQPWTTLKLVLNQWGGFGRRLAQDTGSQALSTYVDAALSDNPRLNVSKALFNVVSGGEGVNSILVNQAEFFMLKQVYDAHKSEFLGYEPTSNSVVSELDMVRRTRIPKNLHQDFALKYAILIDFVDEFIDRMAQNERRDLSPGAPAL